MNREEFEKELAIRIYSNVLSDTVYEVNYAAPHMQKYLFEDLPKRIKQVSKVFTHDPFTISPNHSIAAGK